MNYIFNQNQCEKTWVISYGILETGERERERASENRVARVLGLYFRSTTETIRLQLSLCTNYRTVMFNSPRKDYVHVN